MSEHGAGEHPEAEGGRLAMTTVLHEVRNLASVLSLGLPEVEQAVDRLAGELEQLRARMRRQLGREQGDRLLQGLELVESPQPLRELKGEIEEQQQALRAIVRLLGSGLSDGASIGCDPVERVERLLRRLGPLAAPVRIEGRLGTVPRVGMAGEELDRVILNLVRNAISACREVEGTDRCIRVEVKAAERAVCIVVEDDGPGVPAAVRRRLFQPFVTGGGEGRVGVGLHICWKLVRAAGGTLRHVERPGGGARFELVLPVAR